MVNKMENPMHRKYENLHVEKTHENVNKKIVYKTFGRYLTSYT